MDSDGVDDELCQLDGRRPIALGGSFAVGDDVAFVSLSRTVEEGTVDVGAGDDSNCASAGLQIELYAPLVLARTEIEGVTVDLPAPFFRRPATMSVLNAASHKPRLSDGAIPTVLKGRPTLLQFTNTPPS
jgi:hypothetical protein